MFSPPPPEFLASTSAPLCCCCTGSDLVAIGELLGECRVFSFSSSPLSDGFSTSAPVVELLLSAAGPESSGPGGGGWLWKQVRCNGRSFRSKTKTIPTAVTAVPVFNSDRLSQLLKSNLGDPTDPSPVISRYSFRNPSAKGVALLLLLNSTAD